ncbi:DUF1349 domain-containing protein [Paenibacillus endoradicis]|uniref:DUF1349 domain-containing protein n=1 Tax=Paenibacillus endoradicis TaxID=2972487 RepID=UPI002158D243|nr:DUF1349 domain-containing protein [Paenibacillus endoradicis]MCR8656870.1 DUF1349 domain-containing protein [Paenibacillus endoradicis]
MNKEMFQNYTWLNEDSIRFEEDKLIMYAPGKTDFFNNSGPIGVEGITPDSLTNAPFYYTEVSGDFVMRVKVSHDFKDTYDATSIMVLKDSTVWAKACLELTDFDTHAVVSVVTNQTSDDANGCNIRGNEVWLQMARSGNSFAFHYSVDGVKYDMMRFFTLPIDDIVKVGLLAQAPTGKGGERIYQNYTLELRSVKNIRSGQ